MRADEAGPAGDQVTGIAANQEAAGPPSAAPYPGPMGGGETVKLLIAIPTLDEEDSIEATVERSLAARR